MRSSIADLAVDSCLFCSSRRRHTIFDCDWSSDVCSSDLYRGTSNLLDRWGFYTGYCTSFAAFRLSQEGVVLHGATLQGPNGKSAFFGNGGTWDAAAASIGYVVDAHPTVGSVAVWHGGEDGAWSGGHVAYVMAVGGAGKAGVEEVKSSNYLRYG